MGTSLAFAACAVFVACLDIPDAPDNSGKIQSVEIQVDQFGKRKSSPLKFLSSDSAILMLHSRPTPTRTMSAITGTTTRPSSIAAAK